MKNDRFTVLPQVKSGTKVCNEGNSVKSALCENSDKSKVEIPQQDISQPRVRSDTKTMS